MNTSLWVRILYAYITGIIGAVAIAVGTLLLILPGVYLFIRLYIAIPAVMLYGHGPIEALRVSWRLTRGKTLKVGAIILSVYMIAYGTGFVTSFVVLVGVTGDLVPAFDQIHGSLIFESMWSLVEGSLSAATSTVIYLATRRV